ncbi:MAG: double-strand break repair helicase AddA [Alphaproteobacteria bacterium]|nr:double-strand break repair helicase AddA [Alphaproteobacteria bacterium]
MALISGQHPASIGSPEVSVLVRANAGSGKTTLLVNRVLSLLCFGVAPEKILCLTYTNPAAAEMKNRIIQSLGEWVMMDDERLEAALAKLLDRPVTPAMLRQARGWFAQVLDAPEGIRIHTIHGFCQSLLGRFPLEAGVHPQFRIPDPSIERRLLEAALQHIYLESDQNPALATALQRLSSRGLSQFHGYMKEIIARKIHFSLMTDEQDQARERLERLLGASCRDDLQTLHSRFLVRSPEELKRLIVAAEMLQSSTGVRDQQHGAALMQWLSVSKPNSEAVEAAASLFYKSKSQELSNNIVSKSAGLSVSQMEAISAEQQRFANFYAAYKAHKILLHSNDVVQVAGALLTHYHALKRRHGYLDYDDLILAVRRMLSQANAVPWVQYKLDGGIDHLMVDEAQDTSPYQWEIIAALCDEFFSGQGQSTNPRSLFVVGDEKQSIFSFQGADVASLARMQQLFADRIAAAYGKMITLERVESFRSSSQVLAVVDKVFSSHQARRGVVTSSAPLTHAVTRRDARGMVQLWPLISPHNNPSGRHAAHLARCVARQVKSWLAEGLWLDRMQRSLRPGDVMVLVKSRTVMMDLLVRAFKREGIAVAGADRIRLSENLVVHDLLALARCCLLPQDNLSLAALLKSPLCQISEAQLLDLSIRSGHESLWHGLQSASSEEPYAEAYDFLHHMRSRLDYITPYAWFVEALDTHKKRQVILGRMGIEYADIIDEFLDQVMSFCRTEPPVMQGFLSWFEQNQDEIKRDMEQGHDAVRIMTVHASKGLQAPLVIIPDTAEPPGATQQDAMLWAQDTTAATQLPLLVASQPHDNELTGRLRQQRKENTLAEYRRLLYVAMTRAEDHLLVCGHTGRKTVQEESWYYHIQQAMQQIAQPCDTPTGQGYIFGMAFFKRDSQTTAEQRKIFTALPDYFLQTLAPEPVQPTSLSPSRLLDDEPAAASPLFDPARAARGQLIHQLLQRLPLLPAESWLRAADHLAAAWDVLTAEQRQAAIHEAMAVLHHPQWRFLFGEQSRAEAAIAGRIQLAGREIAVAGQIDRLAVTTQGVWLVDYKTTPKPPENQQKVPKPYLRQLLLYQRLLQQIYPGQPVRAALLWTAAPSLMPIDDALLDETLLSSYI